MKELKQNHMVAGLDIGNGYVKGVIQGSSGVIDEIDIPSGVVLMTRKNVLPTPDSDAVRETKDFFNRLDCSMVSNLVPDQYRRLFGNRSLSAGGSFEEFDVIGSQSKAEQSLSKILVLGCVAGKAVKDYVGEYGVLPDATSILNVSVVCALALPITEFMKYRLRYANEFKGSVHTVTVHNFETPITVKITFTEVQVIAEGASAQYAINKKGVEPINNSGLTLMDIMLRDVRSHGLKLEGVTSADVIAARHTIGIDIGEGTVNFPVFTDGRFNADASVTFDKGYGSVLMQALVAMQEQGFSGGFSSRKQLAAYMQTEPNPIKRNHYNRVKQFVDEEIVFFARELAEKFGHVLDKVGANTEVAYVYGGGSGQVKDALYDLLIDKVRSVSGMDAFPIMYLDSKYSRQLNREGLFIAATGINDMLMNAKKK